MMKTLIKPGTQIVFKELGRTGNSKVRFCRGFVVHSQEIVGETVYAIDKGRKTDRFEGGNRVFESTNVIVHIKADNVIPESAPFNEMARFRGEE